MYKYNLSAFVILLMLFGCTEDIMDGIDENPNSPTDVPVSVLLPQATMNTVRAISGGATSQGTANFVEHTTIVRINFIRPRDVAGSMWNSTYSGLNDLKTIIEKTSEGGNEEGKYTYRGIAKVLYVFTLVSATDMYGDIPHSEALQGSSNRNPEFDSQDSIYGEALDLLDDAIEDLNQESPADPGVNDLIYEGDTTMWIKTAYALKARYNNRLSNVSPEQSAQNALAAVNNSFSGPNESFTFTQYQTGSSNRNPYSAHQQSQNTWAVSITFLDILNEFTEEGYTDPRADIWWHRIDGEFVGAPPGEAVEDGNHTIYSSPSLETIIAEDADQPLITYDELKFIEAEANFRLNNTGEAYEAYREAVNSVLLRTGVSESDAEEYMSQGGVLPGANNLTLEHIMKQKYISFWLIQSEEAYADIRRINIPDSEVFTHPDGFPLRIPYPRDEINRNSNAPDNINDETIYTIPVWWAQDGR